MGSPCAAHGLPMGSPLFIFVWVHLAANEPVQNIPIKSGLFHNWFTQKTFLKSMQITNFECGTRLNRPDRKFTPISFMKNSYNYEKINTRFRPEILHISLHVKFWAGFPRYHTVSRPTTTALSNTLWTNTIHQNKFDCLMKVALYFLILKHAMDICYIFLSSNEYIKKR